MVSSRSRADVDGLPLATERVSPKSLIIRAVADHPHDAPSAAHLPAQRMTPCDREFTFLFICFRDTFRRALQYRRSPLRVLLLVAEHTSQSPVPRKLVRPLRVLAPLVTCKRSARGSRLRPLALPCAEFSASLRWPCDLFKSSPHPICIPGPCTSATRRRQGTARSLQRPLVGSDRVDTGCGTVPPQPPG